MIGARFLLGPLKVSQRTFADCWCDVFFYGGTAKVSWRTGDCWYKIFFYWLDAQLFTQHIKIVRKKYVTAQLSAGRVLISLMYHVYYVSVSVSVTNLFSPHKLCHKNAIGGATWEWGANCPCDGGSSMSSSETWNTEVYCTVVAHVVIHSRFVVQPQKSDRDQM